MAGDKKRSAVFINPPGPSKLYRSTYCTYISKANYIWQPQDFINLSAHVPEDFDLRFFDLSINNLKVEELFKEIVLLSPDLAVVALSSIVFNQDVAFAKDFKARFPLTRLLVLGDIFLERVFWEKGLEFADGLILNSFSADLTNFIERGTGSSPYLILKTDRPKIAPGGDFNLPGKRTPPAKVSIGVPRHELFLNKKYRFPFVKSFLYSTVTTQTGCPFSCNYCTQYRLPVTYRDYNEVLEEIDSVRRLGVRDIFFGDPSFGFPRENATALLNGIIKRNLAMRWVCYTNPALIDGEFLTLMKRAGCHTVIIGVEDEDMDMLREKYQRTLSRTRLLGFSEECLRLDIRICGDFIIGLNSDEAAVNRMVDFAKKLRLDYASFNVLTVLFGSKTRADMIEKGELDPYDVGSDTSGTFGREGRERLLDLKTMATKKFYMRPTYLLRRLGKTRGFEELLIQLEEMVAMFKSSLRDSP